MDTTLATGDELGGTAANLGRPSNSTRAGRALMAGTTGLLLTCSFPHADLGFLAWIALVPFLSTLPYTRNREAALNGYIMGLAYYGGVAYWMGVFAANKIGAPLGVVAWVLAAAIHAPLMALAATMANLVWRRPPIARLLAVPAAWVLVERLGELGTFGMGWGDLGYTQWRYTPILQVTSLTGVFGLTYLIVLANTALVSKHKPSIVCAATILAFAGLWSGAALRVAPGTPFETVAAIQPDINQDVEWSYNRPASSAYFHGTLHTYDALIRQAVMRGAKYVALPETGIPGYVQFDSELHDRVADWAMQNDVAVLAGGRYVNPATGHDENVVFLISPDGRISEPYAKTKLVPFGEYIPYRKLFAFLSNLRVSIDDIQAGSETQRPLVEDQDGASRPLVVGPMVCFESTYSRFARRHVANGANLLTVVTDDTWFGKTAAAQQHLAMSAIRAAETHRALVRSAATGISAIFDSRGRMISQLAWYKQGIVLARVPLDNDITPYVRYGDWFVTACAGLWIGVLIAIGKRRSAQLEAS